MSTPKEISYVNMPVPQRVKALRDHAQVGSQMHSEIAGALAAVLTTNLVESIAAMREQPRGSQTSSLGSTLFLAFSPLPALCSPLFLLSGDLAAV